MLRIFQLQQFRYRIITVSLSKVNSCKNYLKSYSFSLASDTESVHFDEHPVRRNIIRPLRQAIRDNEQVPAKKNSGKKKLRRHLNGKSALLLGCCICRNS